MFYPEMVHIPTGPFVMGISAAQIDRLAQQIEAAQQWSEQGRFRREQPPHTVTLPDYTIGKTPVTVGQFRTFVEAGGYRLRRWWTESGWQWRTRQGRTRPDHWDETPWTDDDRLPVVGVSWYAAVAYCRWLSEDTGRVYRLPTEAEWEKAARGVDGRLFPWGDAFETTRCNMRHSGLGRTVPVGSYSPAGDSPYGCVDMAGNVSEWTQSRFLPYPYDPGDGRDDPAGDRERVTRGGSWHSPVLRVRTVARGMNDPFFTDSDLGFRCASGDG
jgi:formylglycine-generating enzyme required for sulfatase activity